MSDRRERVNRIIGGSTKSPHSGIIPEQSLTTVIRIIKVPDSNFGNLTYLIILLEKP